MSSGAPGFQITPLFRTLLLSGRRAKGHEQFHGLVLAIGWWQGGSDVHYLVSDESQPAPIWVEQSEVEGQSWFAGRGSQVDAQ